MSKVAVSGGGGFLGHHVRAAVLESGETTATIGLGAGYNETAAAEAVDGASQLIHIAGVNRGSDEEVADGNILFARQLAASLASARKPPQRVAFANSTQSTTSNVYGTAKSTAADIVASACASAGVEFHNVMLPNLFGEHGRPFYNSVTATFSHLLATGETPNVQRDQTLTLMHAQNAADLLLGTAPVAAQQQFETQVTVTELLRKLTEISSIYRGGDIPDIASEFDRDLFNTYRSFTFAKQTPIELTRHADARGSFFEIIRSRGGSGQFSFSTTEPGISRGDHFHRRKVERFTVLSGEAEIKLRRLFTPEVFTFTVTGSAPVAIDMPTMWAHNITNTGMEPLLTSFWSNDIFDPSRPDTIAEAVS